MDHSDKALDSRGFPVAQEIFMSETAKFANVVLPGASFFEKSGTFTNGERRVQRVNEVIPPLAGTKTGGQIVVPASSTAWASRISAVFPLEMTNRCG